MEFHSITRRSQLSELTLILMHGLGSDEQDMFGLAEMIDPRVEVICLRAPYRYGPGYAWFDIQWTPQGIQVDPNQYWDSVAGVAHYITTLQSPNLIIGGFSQGAMMSLGLITRFPTLAAHALLLSGRGIENPAPDFGGRIFQAHGLFDDVIPVSDARALHANLQHLGERYEYYEYEMGHWIDQDELRDVNRWLGSLIQVE